MRIHRWLAGGMLALALIAGAPLQAQQLTSGQHIVAGDINCLGGGTPGPTTVVIDRPAGGGCSEHTFVIQSDANGSFALNISCPLTVQVCVYSATSFPCRDIDVNGYTWAGWWTKDCGPSGGGGCMLAGTPISMADGTTKPIEKIEVGDVVLAFDEKSGHMKPDAVVKVYEPVDRDAFLLVNDEIRITPVHRVRTGDEWVAIGKLTVGDELTAADGSPVTIRKMELVQEPVTVYNFHVNPFETYVANGVIVHNRKEEGGEDPGPGSGP